MLRHDARCILRSSQLHWYRTIYGFSLCPAEAGSQNLKQREPREQLVQFKPWRLPIRRRPFLVVHRQANPEKRSSARLRFLTRCVMVCTLVTERWQSHIAVQLVDRTSDLGQCFLKPSGAQPERRLSHERWTHDKLDNNLHTST